VARNSLKKKNGEKQVVRAFRAVDSSNQEIQNFTDRVGRGIAGAGTTRSVGSMAITLLGGAQFNKLCNQLSSKDRSKINPYEVSGSLKDVLKARTETIDLHVEGIGLFGSKRGKVWEPVARLGFSAMLATNPEVEKDFDAINSILSDFHLPTIRLQPRKPIHLSFGDIYTMHITQGQGENPHLLIPSGITVPSEVGLYRPISKVVTWANSWNLAK